MTGRRIPVLAAAATAVVVAGLGAWMTDLGPWYAQLRQPAWKPADAWFAPAWTLIFGLMAMAGARAWRDAVRPAQRQRVIALFGLNIALNLLWSAMFFRFARPDWALAEVVFLWLSVLLLIAGLAPFSRRAGVLLLPYLAWVGFAGWLNRAVVALNGPFGLS